MSDQKRILLAEDERPLSKALELKLSHEGFVVTPVFDGAEALSKLATEQYDIMLLDLMMPEIDGFGVLEELQKRGNKMPVIVTTNLSQPEDLNRVKALGARGFLVKSNTPLSGIIDHIKEIVNSG